MSENGDFAPRSWLQTIVDSSHLLTFCISISVIIYGSFRSLNIDKDNDEYSKHQDDLSVNKMMKRKKKKRMRKKVVSKVVTNLAEENEFLVQESQTTTETLSITTSIDFDSDSDSCSSQTSDDTEYEHQTIQNIDSYQAMFIPVAASISLLLMFFFFESIQTAFVICTSVLATVAFSFLLTPVCKKACKFLLTKCTKSNYLINKKFSCCFLGKFNFSEMLAFSLSSLLVCLWILTGHWLLMDLIGVGFCVTFIAIVRLPSLKVSTLLLVGLVIYDVLWVYFSHLIFSSNVMIKVATKEADNPMNVLARKFNMETQFSKDSPKLSLPGKLVVPSYQRQGNFSILGLGDIVVPGLLLCFVLRFDAYKMKRASSSLNKSEVASSKCCGCPNPILILQSCKFSKKSTYLDPIQVKSGSSGNAGGDFIYQDQPRKIKSDLSQKLCLNCHDRQLNVNSSSTSSITYFHCSLLGYFIGLITATLSSEIFKEAQPALLYLVPFTLLPLLTMAYVKGDLSLMWNEPFGDESNTKYFNVV